MTGNGGPARPRSSLPLGRLRTRPEVTAGRPSRRPGIARKSEGDVVRRPHQPSGAEREQRTSDHRPRPCGAGLGREIALGLSNRGLRVFGTGLLADAGVAMEPHRGVRAPDQSRYQPTSGRTAMAGCLASGGTEPRATDVFVTQRLSSTRRAPCQRCAASLPAVPTSGVQPVGFTANVGDAIVAADCDPVRFR
jgi:hypothetical protein